MKTFYTVSPKNPRARKVLSESVAKVGPEPTPAFGLPAMLRIAMQAGHPSGGGDLKE